ncbi:MAG: prepilin-type N-terminal cleavage/methylation domain-containing protein [Puniceicoccaceae bacterium]|nr:MAG: prepilin-type N-terminal cleavage/methylation domain-containing protein [Puniceicoccaceae bacterium]
MQKKSPKKGFTLVEIMIVVVIIGLLAAMAIPAFQKVRQSSIEKALINDARQLASAAQQYMMEKGTASADSDRLIGTETDKYVTGLGSGNAIVAGDWNITSTYLTDAFTMQNPGLPNGSSILTFDSEGKHTLGGSKGD